MANTDGAANERFRAAGDWVPELRRRPDGGADFSVVITDDSMEPYIRRGETVYVSRSAPMRQGDAGIFYVDGRMVCRQYVEDSEGTIYLFAANRARRDLDLAVGADSPSGVQLFGALVPPRSIPLPGIEEQGDPGPSRITAPPMRGG